MSVAGEEDAFERARELFRAGRTAEAKAVLEQRVFLHPEDVAARYALGVCLNDEEQWAAAEPHLRAVLAAEPQHFLASYEMGKSLQGQGRFGEAAGLFRQALLRENIPDAWRRLQECESPRPTPAAEPTIVAITPFDRPEELAAVGHDRLIPSPAPFRTLASDLDERDSAGHGQLVWSSRTRIREHVPAALVATALCVIVPGFFRPLWVFPLLAAYAIITWAAALITSVASRFDFYERRLNATQGVFNRSKLVIWYASITQVTYTRHLTSYLTNTASLEITYLIGNEHKKVTLAGIGTPGRVNRIYEELQGPVVRERRAMKKILF